MFGRNRRTSGPLPASLAISRTVSAAITETLASSKMPSRRCIILDGSLMATLDLRGQFFSEDGHLFAFRRPDVCRKVHLDPVFMPEGSKQKQIGQLACRQPGKAASLTRAPECETPVAVDSVPAHIGDFNPLAGHGFHRVSEDCFYLSDLDSHGCRA